MEQDRRQESRIDVFLDLYKQLEDALEDKYRNARRHYSSVVFEFIKDTDSEPVRDKLEICREIRNLLTHSANLDGEPIVEPSAPVVAAMEEVLEFVRRPPLALEFATKGDQVMKAHMHQRGAAADGSDGQKRLLPHSRYGERAVSRRVQCRHRVPVHSAKRRQGNSGGHHRGPAGKAPGYCLSHGKLRICSQERHLSFRPADLRAGAGEKQAVSVVLSPSTVPPESRCWGCLPPGMCFLRRPVHPQGRERRASGRRLSSQEAA